MLAVIPDNDSSLNFIIGMMYSSIFQELYYVADQVYGGRLPVHVHCVMDEFANVALPDEFDKLLATMRSREISVSIIIQNIAQLKALFEKQWESIIGNCDEFLYLGGNETSTHKMISESYLGRATIDTNTYGKSTGRNGSYSTNYQLSGRELYTADEVRMLDNRYALLFIRGEHPIQDEKYDILRHPNISFTADGGMPPICTGKRRWHLTRTRFFSPANTAIMKRCPKKRYLSFTTTKRRKRKMTKKTKRAFAMLCAITMIFTVAATAFATDDPLQVINNLSEFIFGLIRAIGMILLAFGIVQIGLSLKSHDPSQRANGFLTFAGGIIITFAREILNLITG